MSPLPHVDVALATCCMCPQPHVGRANEATPHTSSNVAEARSALDQPESRIGRIAVEVIPRQGNSTSNLYVFRIAADDIGHQAHAFVEFDRGDAERQPSFQAGTWNAHSGAGVNLPFARDFAPFEISAAGIDADRPRIMLEAVRVFAKLQHELAGARAVPERLARHVNIRHGDGAAYVRHWRPPGSSRRLCPSCGRRE